MPGHARCSDSPQLSAGALSFAWPRLLAVSCALENHGAVWGDDSAPQPTAGVYWASGQESARGTSDIPNLWAFP